MYRYFLNFILLAVCLGLILVNQYLIETTISKPENTILKHWEDVNVIYNRTEALLQFYNETNSTTNSSIHIGIGEGQEYAGSGSAK